MDERNELVIILTLFLHVRNIFVKKLFLYLEMFNKIPEYIINTFLCFSKK